MTQLSLLPDVDDPAPGPLADYDWILVNSSAGKDSQAMLDVVIERSAAAAVDPQRIVVVHADLGRVEWPGTRELAEVQARHYGLRFEVTKSTGGDLLERVEARGMWPDAARRWCTSDLKRGPIYRILTRLTAEWRAAGGEGRCRILNCLGLRAEESPARAKRIPFFHNQPASNGRRHVDEWYPIHRWNVEDVWERIRRSGVPHHPAYDQGMPRLSCTLCILASRSALILGARLRPDLADQYLQVEKTTGHSFRLDLSMEEIVAAAAQADAVTAADWAA